MTVGDSGALRPEEIDDLLRRPLVARLATLDPDGYPSVVPVWIEWDGTTVWLVGRATADYVANLDSDPRVGLSIVDADDPDRRVQLRGRGTIVEGPAPLTGRTLAIARSMAKHHEGARGVAYIKASQDWPRVLIAIAPDRVRSWGSPDWHPRYPRHSASQKETPEP